MTKSSTSIFSFELKALAERIADWNPHGLEVSFGAYHVMIGLTYDYCNPIDSANILVEFIETVPVLPDGIFS